VKQFYGWKLLVVFFLILLISSSFTLYAGGVINAYMATDLGLDRKAVGLPMSIFQLVFGLGAPVVGAAIDRFGIRRTLTAGGFVLAVGAAAMASLVHGGLAAALVFGLVLGSGGALAGGIATQAGVARWFTRRRALAFALLFTAPGLGGFFVAPLVDSVIRAADGNWRVGWWLVAAMGLVVAALAALFVREHPSDLGQVPDGAAPVAAVASATATGREQAPRRFISAEEWAPRDVWRNHTYWLMLLAVLGVNAGYTLFFAVGVVHLQDFGQTRSGGAGALSAFGISALLGKLALGVLGDRIDPRYVWAATVAGFGVGMWLIAAPTTAFALNAFPVFLGFGFGGGMGCMMAVISNYFGPKAFPRVAGVAVAATASIGALSPLVVGALYDQIGGYGRAFVAFAAWCAVGVLVLLFVPRPRRAAPSGHA
jgi:MFS family permease